MTSRQTSKTGKNATKGPNVSPSDSANMANPDVGEGLATEKASSDHPITVNTLVRELEKSRKSLAEELTKSLETSLAPIKASLEDIRSTVASHSSTISDMETALTDHSDRITELENNTTTLQTKLTSVTEENVSLQAKVEDLVSRSKRQNIRVVGLPEDMEGRDARQFMSALFQSVVGRESFPEPPELDRAHRSLRRKPRQGERPRPVIVRFHRFIEKDLVLQWAREHREASYQGHSIKFYEDFSPITAKKRAAFNDVKAALYKKGVRFGLLYPARLRISFQGTDHFFDSPAQADDFFQRNINV